MSFDHKLQEVLETEWCALRAKQLMETEKLNPTDAVNRAVKEYCDPTAWQEAIQWAESKLHQAQQKKIEEDRLRAEGKPTLKTSFGDLLRKKGKTL